MDWDDFEEYDLMVNDEPNGDPLPRRSSGGGCGGLMVILLAVLLAIVVFS
ncbi:MAG: hypothetical protein J6C44_01550 [Muribaculaceae bacterium]|nr:hypothetical protein [Muribaculaceae bacterium]